MNRIELSALSRLWEKRPLVTALVISLAIHASLYGGWKWGKRLGLWNHQATWLLRAFQPASARSKNPLLAANRPPKPLANESRQQIPLVFVDVDPSAPAAEPPPNTPFYSSKSVKAANPEPVKADAPKPKIDGKQDKVIRVADVTKTEKFPLQPSPPQTKPEETLVETPPKPKIEKTEPLPPQPKIEKAGDLAMLRPSESKTLERRAPSDGQASSAETPVVARTRPRTVAEAKRAKGMMVGEKIKQEGGALNVGDISFPANFRVYGDYDRLFIEAVRERWYQLLEARQYPQQSGKVVIEFRLFRDGSIKGLRMNQNEVGDWLGLICEKAVEDPQPYQAWPEAMYREIGKSYRDVSFTFYYN